MGHVIIARMFEGELGGRLKIFRVSTLKCL